MTGDDQFPEPGPVAEYRDPELVRQFESDPVPQHGAGFWTELEARLGGGEAELVGVGARADHDDEVGELLPLTTATDPVVAPTAARRWGAGRLVAVAAAMLAVLGVGGAVLVAQSRSSSPVESAAPDRSTAIDDEVEEYESSPSTTSTTSATTTTTTASTAVTSGSSTAVAGAADYFADEVRVEEIGPGRVVAFSPDDGSVLVVDDAPGVAAGCEGAELLMLYGQNLATGARRPAVDDGLVVETGGLDLAISPFGSTPGEVGTRPVYGQDWCDGEANTVWRGVMATDGTISMVQPVEAGTADDPFAAEPPAGRNGYRVPSPDGEHVLVVSASAALVAEAGPEPGGTEAIVATLPDDVEVEGIRDGLWSPSGEVVALSADRSVVLWSPWTGEYQHFESGPVNGLVFDNTGGRLAVVSWDDGVASSMLTFGDRGELVPAPPRCSGRVAFAPLTAAGLASRGLPPEVIETVLTIDQAAATCQWEILGRLTPDGFVASLGGGDPVELWRQKEATGQSPMWYLRTLFRQPTVVDDESEPAVHIWPSIQQDGDCRLDETERASVIALGSDPAEAEEACITVGGYAGYRTVIDAAGRWRVFVAGE